jgi:hypothetical protein
VWVLGGVKSILGLCAFNFTWMADDTLKQKFFLLFWGFDESASSASERRFLGELSDEVQSESVVHAVVVKFWGRHGESVVFLDVIIHLMAHAAYGVLEQELVFH